SAEIDRAAAEQRMGSDLPEPARFGREIVRAHSGVAGTGAPYGAQHRQSRAAGRFPRAELERRRGAKTGAPRRARRRETGARRAKIYFRAARDRADPGETAKGRGVAIFRCAASRLPAFTNQSDPA